MKDDKSDPVATAFVFQILGAGIIGIFAIFSGFILPPIAEYPVNFFLQGTLWGIATFCLFKATQYIEASEVTIIATSTAIVTIIACVVLLDEQFTLPYLIGTLLIISAVVYISSRSAKMKFNKGVLYALSHSIFAGFGLTNDTYLLRYSDTLSYLTLGFLTTGIFLLALRPQSIRNMKDSFKPGVFSKILLLSIFYAFGSIAFFLAISAGAQVSQVSPINQSAIILTILLAAVFLKEKDHLLKKAICALLVTIGVLLLR